MIIKITKIEKIHISQEADELYYTVASMPTLLMINGILHSCDMMPFVDQFQKIAESIETHSRRCRALIVSSLLHQAALFWTRLL
jgi:hypothetical protein